MSDLKAKCPKCGMIIYRYIHHVDHFGMGLPVPSGKYRMICEPSGYMNTDKKPEKYCGKKFTVRVSEKIEVLSR